MYLEPRGSFRPWLLEQADRHDPVGDLAGDLIADISDGCLGQRRTPNAILAHIQAEHYPCDDAIAAFRVAVAEWKRT
jgi:hypothetical protein